MGKKKLPLKIASFVAAYEESALPPRPRVCPSRVYWRHPQERRKSKQMIERDELRSAAVEVRFNDHKARGGGGGRVLFEPKQTPIE